LAARVNKDRARHQRIPLQRIAYSLQELEDATSLSRRFLRLEIAKGRLHAIKIGARVLVLASELEAYLLAGRTDGV
jgi:hypothetical protein